MLPGCGTVMQGEVQKIMPYGAFISLGEGSSGMVHISEISSSFVRDIGEYLSVGDIVRVKVLSVDEKGRLALSIKQAQNENQKNMDDSFEKMLSRFRALSNERMSDIRKNDQNYRRKSRK